jgi:hypothetical protein|tara:strand:+ start:611 stop:1912 length:1302 start_codon:yes stop_codon:yes gene_type:complete
MFQTEHLQEKWQPVLGHPDLPEIKDSYRRAVTTVILENQERAMREDSEFLREAAPQNATGSAVANWDPILISLVRRAMPSLIAYDICGVQPMTGPTGLIFAMKARYTSQSGTEALFNEADTTFGGAGTHTGSDVLKTLTTTNFQSGTGMTTAAAEALGDSASNAFAEMAFSIEKATVTAKSRALKAEYTMELAQDLKAIHGLDAETELANILSSEILAEINREVVRTVYRNSKQGAAINTSTAGIFDLDTDSNGRWSVEKFKGLMFSIERDANVIARDTRRGKGNIILCSADVASALTMAGLLDYSSGLSDNLNVDSTGNTFAGTLNGRFKVYVDPYMNMGVPYTGSGAAANQYYVVGYKGTSPYDAGLFYCPYVPLQMVRAVGENSFQPKIGFKTRYGMQVNPFAESSAQTTGAGSVDANVYYRRVQVTNLM